MIDGAAQRGSSHGAAVQGAAEEEHDLIVEAQAVDVPPALLLALLHLSHLLHRPRSPVPVRVQHCLQERLRSPGDRLSSHPALRG